MFTIQNILQRRPHPYKWLFQNVWWIQGLCDIEITTRLKGDLLVGLPSFMKIVLLNHALSKLSFFRTLKNLLFIKEILDFIIFAIFRKVDKAWLLLLYCYGIRQIFAYNRALNNLSLWRQSHSFIKFQLNLYVWNREYWHFFNINRFNAIVYIRYFYNILSIFKVCHLLLSRAKKIKNLI